MFWPFNKTKNIFDYDTFYLTYDEPGKDERWPVIKNLLPNAKRVDGIKGFDKAHKECARIATTERLTIIDGDNSFDTERSLKLTISKKLLKKNYVFSYSSKNSINGLIYGNGGIKCWPKKLLLTSNSHESSTTEDSSVDFCFTIPYYQVPESPTISNVNITAFQAFRAGYREGVKMSLDKGHLLSDKQKHNLDNTLFKGNVFRLRTWCEVGRDVENGIWAIYGARLGLFEILEKPETLENIRDYEWFYEKWNQVQSLSPEDQASLIATKLQDLYQFKINELDSAKSSEFKKNLKNPRREGLMFPEMEE